MKVFISYSRRSRDFVAELAEHLELINHMAWYDQELDRQGGQPWWQRILQEIRACEVFMFALSAHSLRSKPCLLELDYAMRLHKRIIPVIISEDVSIAYLPLDLQALQMVDYRKHSIPQLKALKATLSNLPPALPLPRPLPSEPPTPFDRVSVLTSRLNVESMTPDEQKAAARDLEDLIEEGEDSQKLIELLAIFLGRRDLTLKTANKLGELQTELFGTAVTRIRRPTGMLPPRPV
jgi:hypothetical protein